MKAYEKFENRLRELNIYDRWCKIGQIGRIGAETEDNIIVLVHEADDDAYTEFTFPSMREMSVKDDFRDRALAEFVDAGDEKFIRELVWWWINPKNKCPLFPEDVYHLWDDCSYIDFEDDAEEENNKTETTEEYCPHCDTTVDLEHDFKVQKCPNCGKWLAPCSICPLENCSKHCPLERLACMLNGEE